MKLSGTMSRAPKGKPACMVTLTLRARSQSYAANTSSEKSSSEECDDTDDIGSSLAESSSLAYERLQDRRGETTGRTTAVPKGKLRQGARGRGELGAQSGGLRFPAGSSRQRFFHGCGTAPLSEGEQRMCLRVGTSQAPKHGPQGWKGEAAATRYLSKTKVCRAGILF